MKPPPDINGAFADPTVAAIVAAIGGDHLCQLVPLLDFDLIRENPKILMGFSDISVLNVAIWAQTGLVTFNGPALLPDFAEYPDMPAYTKERMLAVIARAEAPGPVPPCEYWTEEDLTRPRKLWPSPGWAWLKPGYAEGVLIGGCLESLEHVRGTRFWPNWRGAILFIETSEGAPPPSRVDSIVMDYENMGVLDEISGLLVGRPMRYSARRFEIVEAAVR